MIGRWRSASSPAALRMLAERTGMPLSARQFSSALAAGCHAALVQWPGVVASPLGAQPDIVGPT